MTALVRRWRASTDTQAVFAERNRISRAKLRYWLRRVERTAMAEAVAFTPVRVLGPTGGGSGAVDVVLASGERLVVRSDASVDLVRTVLAALRSPC